MKGDKWFKFYVKAIWSPSLRKLTATQRWIWNTLLALATEDDGNIRGNAANLSHISAASATDVRGMQQAVAKMQHLCLINVRKNGDIKIRNWSKYQSTTAERRERKVRRNGGEKRPGAGTEKKLEVDKKLERDKIFTAWNEHPKIFPKHQKITGPMKSTINARLQDFTVDQICQAIKNYGDSNDTFWVENREVKKIWGLGTFLSRGEGEKVEKFLAGPINEIRKGSAPGAGTHRAITCEGEIFDGEGTCLDIELNEQGVCAKQKTCPNFRKHE